MDIEYVFIESAVALGIGQGAEGHWHPGRSIFERMESAWVQEPFDELAPVLLELIWVFGIELGLNCGIDENEIVGFD